MLWPETKKLIKYRELGSNFIRIQINSDIKISATDYK